MDAASLASGTRPRFPEVPEDTKASQLVDPHIGKEGFLDVFGRPPRESSCECERRSDFSLPQALNLVNGKAISEAVADPKERAALFDRMVAEAYQRGKAANMASHLEIDGVIDPAETRAWILRGLAAAQVRLAAALCRLARAAQARIRGPGGRRDRRAPPGGGGAR